MNLYKTTKIEIGKCGTCGKTVVTHVAPVDFYGSDGTHHYMIQAEGHCGTPGHNMLVTTVTWNEIMGIE